MYETTNSVVSHQPEKVHADEPDEIVIISVEVTNSSYIVKLSNGTIRILPKRSLSHLLEQSGTHQVGAFGELAM